MGSSDRIWIETVVVVVTTIVMTISTLIGIGWIALRQRIAAFLSRPTVAEKVDEIIDQMVWLEAQLHVTMDGYNRPLLRADAKGQCTFVNRAWQRLTGMSREDALQMGWLDAIHPEDREQVEQEWRRLNGKRYFEMRFRFTRPGGGMIRAYGYALAVVGPEHKLLGYVGVINVEKHPG